MLLLLLFLLIVLASSVTLLETSSVLLTSLVTVALVTVSARFYFLEIFHVVYILTYLLYIKYKLV